MRKQRDKEGEQAGDPNDETDEDDAPAADDGGGDESKKAAERKKRRAALRRRKKQKERRAAREKAAAKAALAGGGPSGDSAPSGSVRLPAVAGAAPSSSLDDDGSLGGGSFAGGSFAGGSFVAGSSDVSASSFTGGSGSVATHRLDDDEAVVWTAETEAEEARQMLFVFEQAFEWVERVRRADAKGFSRVLIHSKRGKHRCLAVAFALVIRLERLTLAEVDKHFVRVSQEKHSLEKLPRPWREALAAFAERHETGRMFCEECFDDWRHGEDEGVTGELVDRAAERLAEGDETLLALEHRGEQLRVPGADKLAEALAVNATLTGLELSGNAVGDAGAAVVAAALAANDALTSLELRYNAIGDAGARHLARALALSPLAHLDLACV